MFVPLNPGFSRLRKTNAFTQVTSVLSGMLQAVSDTILHPAILLSAVAFLLNGSNYQIAAFSVVALASWTLVALVPEILPGADNRTFLIMIGACAIRLIAAALLAFTGFRSPLWGPENVIRTLLIGFFFYQASSAIIGHLSVANLVGVRPTAKRSILFPQRALAASTMAVIGGAVVWSVNRPIDDIRAGLGMLFILAAISIAASTWFLLAIPVGKRRGRSGESNDGESRGFLSPFRSRTYRRFVLFRVALGLAAAADPFIIVFGISRLGLTLEDIGLALVAFAIGHLGGLLIWPRLSPMQSPRAPFQLAALFRLLALIVALGIPAIATSTLYTDRFTSPDAAIRIFLVQFLFIGMAVSAHAIANQRYLIDISPPVPLHQTVFTTNVVHGILAFAPLAAAYLVDRTSLDQMLWVAAALAFVALMVSGLLAESRVSVNRRTGSRIQQRGAPRRLGVR